MEQTKEIRAYLSHQKKLTILKFVKEWNSINKTLKQFKIPKSAYYKWKKAFDKERENGLSRKHPVACNYPLRVISLMVGYGDAPNSAIVFKNQYSFGPGKIQKTLRNNL